MRKTFPSTHYRFTVPSFIFYLFFVSFVQAQPKTVTLNDIYGPQGSVFTPRSVSGVNWMKAGGFYTAQQSGKVIKYSIATGEAVETLFDQSTVKVEGTNQNIQFDSYELSADERKLLLTTGIERIYRRSFKAEFYVYDLASKKLVQLSKNGKQMLATLSPDGSKVAFVRDNNLYLTDLSTLTEQAITTDGKRNEILNGASDWVYEEEFSFAKAFEWAPDGKKIAFYRFDESRVPEYNMQLWGDLYPKDYRYKYPKAGEANSLVEIWVHDLASNKKTKVDVGPEGDQYIPRIKWTQNPGLLSIKRMNRLQNRLDILHSDAATGKSKTVWSEESKTYVDLEFTDDLSYLADGKSFIQSSERSGYKHLYQYDMNGTLLKTLTSGNWEVTDLVGIDEKTQTLYFTSPMVSPMERHLYSLSFATPPVNKKSKKPLPVPQPVKLTEKSGSNTVNMSPDFSYYLIYNQSTQEPLAVSLHQTPTGKAVRTLEANQKLRERLTEYRISKQEFFKFTTTQGTSLNGWMMKPLDFDPTKKYPVLMFVYGGPGSQTVTDTWGGGLFYWFQVLASKGYMIVSVDGRGTGARGNAFRTVTYAQLGKYETEDQIEGAKYLATLPYVDASRIGIHGHSYGGYMASLCMTIGADYFKAGIAGAPVTTWRYYDTVYTERYLKRPQDNASGYDDNSPIQHVNKLKGKFFIVHGTGDDNVHFQNSVDFVNALIKAGKQFDSFYYPNRNHGISGGNTLMHRYQMMTDWVLKNL
ncbi:S9 family peptidase [Runella aurantiaca]|uniref:S9 family peptidase n=1 Tax=Runella aurantiaca TaxID=2282308 RepID=A0A369I6U3_9BACT|nr:S9 family peptidase [Runella aurantiaca]RDB04207.1 S9 family peptidase [Runella aurantiaca]